MTNDFNAGQANFRAAYENLIRRVENLEARGGFHSPPPPYASPPGIASPPGFYSASIASSDTVSQSSSELPLYQPTQEQLRENALEMGRLQLQLRTTKNEVSHLTNQLADKQQQFETTREELESTKSKLSQVTKQLNIEKRRLKQTSEQLKTAQLQRDSFTLQSHKLEQELKDCRKHSSELTDRNETQKSTILELQRQLRENYQCPPNQYTSTSLERPRPRSWAVSDRNIQFIGTTRSYNNNTTR